MNQKNQNANKFVMIYNELDQYMRKTLRVGDEISNSQLIKEMSRKNKVFRNNEDDLLGFSKLRNAIVHNPYKKIADPIAEPHENIVMKYEDIMNRVIHPPKALDTIAVRANEIYTIKMEDNAYEVIKKMSENSFTHVPVYEDDKFVGVFSENTLFSYMVKKEDVIITKDSLIEEFSEFIPIDNHVGEYFEFVDKQALIIDIEEKFNNYLEDLKRLGVIFITETGKQTEQLLGLITAWDIAGYEGCS